MKKNSIIVFLFLFVLSLTSCGKKEVNEMNLTKDFIASSTPINKISMTDYRLEDLYSFFGESSLNENLVFDNGTKIITLNQVNQAFPIECLRTGGDNFYTIYKVLEGGFFYVFWSEALTNNIDENNVYVYFSTYINSLKNKNDFKNLKEGDTAQDVYEIDPSLEISFSQSSGIYSYNLLDNEKMLEIKYRTNNNMSSKKDLIVDTIRTIDRKIGAGSLLATINKDDLPQ